MQKKYSNSVPKIYKLDYKLIMDKLKEYGNRCEAKGSILTILIGSLAKKDYSPFSDADIVIINKTQKNIIDFLAPDMPIDIEPRLYAINEVYNMSKEKKRIVYEMVKNGIVLSGDKDLLDKIRELYYR